MCVYYEHAANNQYHFSRPKDLFLIPSASKGLQNNGSKINVFSRLHTNPA